MNVAIIGGTGRLGLPVAHSLKQQGMHITIVTRDVEASKLNLGTGFKYAQADVSNMASLVQALKGMDAVHINLSGVNAEECKSTIHHGTEHIVKAAQINQLSLISMISGTTVCEDNRFFYDIDAKYAAEQTLINSGIPYLIFRPSWFMETLPQFVEGKRASIFGPGKQLIHWLAVDDYTEIVSCAYADISIRNKRLTIHGPDAVSLTQAVSMYADHLEPKPNVSNTPYWFAPIISWLTKKPAIQYASDLCRYYEKVGDVGDPSETNSLFGPPSSNLKQWCNTHK